MISIHFQNVNVISHIIRYVMLATILLYNYTGHNYVEKNHIRTGGIKMGIEVNGKN